MDERKQAAIEADQATTLGRLALVIARRRWLVIGVWIVLTVIGAFAAGQLSKRWYQSFSIPGKPAYEASQRTLKDFGVGVRPPNTVVFRDSSGDVTRNAAIAAAIARAAKTAPGSLTSSYWNTHNPMYLSKDRHTTFANIYLPGSPKFNSTSGAKEMRAAAAQGLPAGVTVQVTGPDPLEEASTHGDSGSWPVTWTWIPCGSPRAAAVRRAVAPLLVEKVAGPGG